MIYVYSRLNNYAGLAKILVLLTIIFLICYEILYDIYMKYVSENCAKILRHF